MKKKKCCQYINTEWKESLCLCFAYFWCFFLCAQVLLNTLFWFTNNKTAKLLDYYGSLGSELIAFYNSNKFGMEPVQTLFKLCMRNVIWGNNGRTFFEFWLTFFVVLLEYKLIKSRPLIWMSGTPVFIVQSSTVHCPLNTVSTMTIIHNVCKCKWTTIQGEKKRRKRVSLVYR